MERDTHYPEYLHPNLQKPPQASKPEGKLRQTIGFSIDPEEKRSCSHYFKMLDEHILRPILIYKYDHIKFMEEIDYDTVLVQEEVKAL
jgi:hypothetical protein